METLNFTKAALSDLPVPDRRTRYRDAGQPGLVLAVSPGGSRVFYIFKRSGGRLHEVRIGAFPATSIDDARRKTREGLTALEANQDPRAAVGRPRGGDLTFGDVFTWWVQAYGRFRSRPEEPADVYRRHLKTPLHNRQAHLLNRAELRELHADLGERVGKRTANIAIALVRVALARAIQEGLLLGPNPALAIALFDCPPRERRLKAEEIPAFFKSLAKSTPDVQDFVMLSLFTGARRGNLQSMRWDEIDQHENEWRIGRTKSGRAQTIPLEEGELVILRRRLAGKPGQTPWVFPGRTGGTKGHIVEPKNGWRAIVVRAGLTDLHLHDLRRSLGSWMLRGGAKMEVISATLGHSSIKVTERVYAHMDTDPIRAAKRRAHVGITDASTAEPKEPGELLRSPAAGIEPALSEQAKP